MQAEQLPGLHFPPNPREEGVALPADTGSQRILIHETLQQCFINFCLLYYSPGHCSPPAHSKLRLRPITPGEHPALPSRPSVGPAQQAPGSSSWFVLIHEASLGSLCLFLHLLL